MRSRIRVASLGLVASIAAAGALSAQVTVTGVVREDGSQRALEGVLVLIEGTKREATTDAAGRFRIDAPSGNRVALFRGIGFHPSRVRMQLIKGDSVTVDAVLVKQQPAQQLDPIVTTAKPAPPRGIGVGVEAFEERRKLGFGKFVDSAELRRAGGRRLTDVLRGIQGIRLISYVENPDRPDLFELRAVGRTEEMFGEPCWMSVLVDGSPIYRSSGMGRPPDFRREFHDVSSFHAVEVYRSASEVPMEFGGPGEQCGLLMLWTRRPGG
jgi:hypothetical protein